MVFVVVLGLELKPIWYVDWSRGNVTALAKGHPLSPSDGQDATTIPLLGSQPIEKGKGKRR